MTLRERFDSIDRKLDRILKLVGADSLEQAEANLEKIEAGLRRARGEPPEPELRRATETRLTDPPIRLLVSEDGENLWRTVEGVCLVGRVHADGALSPMGGTAKNGDRRDYSTDWYVIRARSGKFVVYARPGDSSIGTIRIVDSLPDLKAVLPANLFADVEQAVPPPPPPAGYRELPLEGV
jgi:hypothetical protein